MLGLFIILFSLMSLTFYSVIVGNFLMVVFGFFTGIVAGIIFKVIKDEKENK
jgi:ABC-type polysaccharide/polyol phosphate export permease